MKAFLTTLLVAGAPCLVSAQSSQSSQALYTNFIRQVQLSSGVHWDVPVEVQGERTSHLAVDSSGARFELWTVLSNPLTSYLLDTRFVSTYAPTAEVVITSEDPYQLVPRTRADRPFQVQIAVNGLLNQTNAPISSKSVRFLRHVQSYGPGGIGMNLDRSQATLVSNSMVTQNGNQTFNYSITSVPGADRTKVRGEERFSFFSLAEPGTAEVESQIASRYVQIWPVADGSIAGISANQRIRVQLPQLTFTVNDIYPGGMVYAQAYPGPAKLGTLGTRIPGTSYGPIGDVPEGRVMVLDSYDSIVNVDGTWTIELLTITPFGVDRLAHVTFEIDRILKINGTLTTIE